MKACAVGHDHMHDLLRHAMAAAVVTYQSRSLAIHLHERCTRTKRHLLVSDAGYLVQYGFF
jgi:hypothetical protein